MQHAACSARGAARSPRLLQRAAPCSERRRQRRHHVAQSAQLAPWRDLGGDKDNLGGGARVGERRRGRAGGCRRGAAQRSAARADRRHARGGVAALPHAGPPAPFTRSQRALPSASGSAGPRPRATRGAASLANGRSRRRGTQSGAHRFRRLVTMPNKQLGRTCSCCVPALGAWACATCPAALRGRSAAGRKAHRLPLQCCAPGAVPGRISGQQHMFRVCWPAWGPV